jgi:nucleotide-binding universal stress UspA family protein
VIINRILVPLDGSAHAFKALDLASEIAVKYDATLLLLHAIPDEVELSEPQRRFARAEHIEGSLDQMQFTLAEQQLMTSARHRALQTGVRQVDTLVEPGDPAKVIIDHATDVDMIVMGRRGLGPIEGLLQGYCRAIAGQRVTKGQPARRRRLRYGQVDSRSAPAPGDRRRLRFRR